MAWHMREINAAVVFLSISANSGNKSVILTHFDSAVSKNGVCVSGSAALTSPVCFRIPTNEICPGAVAMSDTRGGS